MSPGVMMKRLFTVLAALFVVASLPGVSHAFTLSVDNQQSTVDVDQVTSFTFTIYSNESDSYSVNVNGLKPWMTIEDIGYVPANTIKTFHLYASPSYMVPAGTYGVNVSVTSETTNETEGKTVYITALKSIFASIDKIYVSGSLQPAGYADVKIDIRNLDVVTMMNIDVIATISSPSGVIDSFNQTIDSIDPLETRTVERQVTLPPEAEAGKYSVQVSAFYNKKIFNQKSQDFDVISIPVIRIDRSESPTFIGTEKVIEVSNVGNYVASDVNVDDTVSGFQGNFFFQVRGPDAVIRNGIASWTISSINPGGSVKLVYQINYLPLIMIILFVIAAIWFIMFNVRVVEVVKTVSKKTDDDITVNIEIRNKTGMDLDNVILKDSVPLIFRVRSFMGLAPVRKKDDQGFALIWRIKKLKSAEERIFSYKILPVIKVAGTMRLPSAKILYKHLKTVFAKKSNSPKLGWQA